MNKPNLIIRIHNYNKVSLGAILGACPPALLNNFTLVPWVSDSPIPVEAAQARALIVYSIMLPHLQQVAKELKQLHDAGSAAETIAGGSQATAAPNSVSELGFDYVVCGEAEDYFPQFLGDWLVNSARKGLHTTSRGKVDLNLYPGFSELVGYLPPLEISRGCKFGCMFCGVPRLHAGTLRHRSLTSIEAIVKEYFRIKPTRKRIKFLASNAFAYGSDGRQPNLAALKDLLEMLKRIGVPEIHLGSFPSEVRPDFVTPEVMQLVAPYLSNKTIVMGVQTGSDNMLKKMNRGHGREHSVRAIALLREFGFQPHIDFIVGNPDETEDDQFELIDFMDEMLEKYQVRIHMHTFVPLPATPWENKLQSPIHEKVKQRLRELERAGVLDGWWENHIGYFRTAKG
ncbi:MAG: TIGR04013 family B12-binding domain/radical SAM domain-containing protein [Candidatus Riflebacteria bacterium HGW-Riflebacteria-1]|jgi:B12-binding domain/radical SAM domain protein|nr:MAG: TIGR04013 family B12-binding domain/radical SAM domain-containing protein [Candidatus Riflebacteria bacterium HGW-Riflebacteria-1]